MPKTLALVERHTSSLVSRVGEALRSYTIGPMSLKDPALAAFFGAGRTTTAGITVSDAMAFTMSAVFCAVDNISSDVAKVPLILKKRIKDGGTDDNTRSKLYRLMKDQPNPDMSSFTFRKTLIAHALTCTGGYAEIERDELGFPAALWILTPDRVAPFLEKTALPDGRYRGRLKYRIDGTTVLDSADVIHIHGLGYDGYTGYSIVDKARQAIGLALAAERFGASFFGNGAVFGGVVSTDQSIGPDKEDELRKQVNEYHGSSDKAHRLLFLSGGWKYTKTGVAPNEAQMDELRDKQCMEVARFFNFPLYKLKVAVSGAQSFASNEQADLDYYKGPLLNWYINCEQEFNRKLIPSLEASQQFFKHNVNAFMRADATARTGLYTALLDRGVYCADDVLELEDLNPQPGGIGKIFLVQGAMVPKDKIGAMVDASIEAKKQPKAVPAPQPVDPNADQNARALADALTRATAAEQLAGEARAEAQRERESRIAMESTGTAQAGEIARLVESERALSVRAGELEGVAASVRAEAESLRAAGVLAAAEIEELRAAAVLELANVARLTAERDAATATLDAQLVSLNDLSARQELTAGELARLTEERDAGMTAFSELNQRWVALADDLTASRAAQDALQAERAAAIETSRQAEVSRLEAERHAAEAEGAAVEARATVARCLEDVARLAGERQSDQSARDAAESEARLAVEARTAAEQLAEMVRQEAAQAVLQAAQARTEATSATEAAAVSAARIVELEAIERQALQERQAAVEAWTAVDAARETSSAEAVRLAGLLATAEAERETLRQAVTDAETARAGALESVTRAEAAIAERDGRLVSERSTAESGRADLERRATDQSAAIVELQRQLAEVREADARGVAAMIAAHRGTIVYKMQGLVEFETDRLRRAQATPEKMRAAMATFYEAFTDRMARALVPELTVHLAFIRSGDDPMDEARRLAEGHVRESRRQLEMMLDGEPDVYAGSVTALWHRWETERAAPIADALMAKELDYARR